MKLNPFFATLIVVLVGTAYVLFIQNKILAFTDDVEQNTKIIPNIQTSPEGIGGIDCRSPIAGVCMPDRVHRRGS